MSEIQNKAVALLTQNEGDLFSQPPHARGALFLRRALELYFALGGDETTATDLIEEGLQTPRLRVEAAVANVMMEVAAVSHLNDIDMIQAAYNRLDAELKAPGPLR